VQGREMLWFAVPRVLQRNAGATAFTEEAPHSVWRKPQNVWRKLPRVVAKATNGVANEKQSAAAKNYITQDVPSRS